MANVLAFKEEGHNSDSALYQASCPTYEEVIGMIAAALPASDRLVTVNVHNHTHAIKVDAVAIGRSLEAAVRQR